jgi:hypothetical protein
MKNEIMPAHPADAEDSKNQSQDLSEQLRDDIDNAECDAESAFGVHLFRLDELVDDELLAEVYLMQYGRWLMKLAMKSHSTTCDRKTHFSASG